MPMPRKWKMANGKARQTFDAKLFTRGKRHTKQIKDNHSHRYIIHPRNSIFIITFYNPNYPYMTTLPPNPKQTMILYVNETIHFLHTKYYI